jgi:Ser/Thr protein kinase RdoA (MazF antagonist)
MTHILPDQPIAQGRTADIYAWEDGQILKLYHAWVRPEGIKHEARVGRSMQTSGLPTPRVGEIVQVGGRHGLLYERLYGPSMLEMLLRKPWRRFDYAQRLAALHVRVHTHPVTVDLPRQRRRLDERIRQADALPAHGRTALLSALAALPDGDQICHGDFHPANILLTTQGDVVIDWNDATLGNPLADVARFSVLALGAVATPQIPSRRIKRVVRHFHDASLRRYFQLRPGGEDEYRRWLPIMAAARLSEGIPELTDWLVAQALDTDA